MAPVPYNPTYSSGSATPESELESILPVHPTAARREYPIVVQSEHTTYTDEHISAKFVNRGADVVVTNGQYIVTPSAKPYEFQTVRKVPKTGYVIIFSAYMLPFLILFPSSACC